MKCSCEAKSKYNHFPIQYKLQTQTNPNTILGLGWYRGGIGLVLMYCFANCLFLSRAFPFLGCAAGRLRTFIDCIVAERSFWLHLWPWTQKSTNLACHGCQMGAQTSFCHWQNGTNSSFFCNFCFFCRGAAVVLRWCRRGAIAVRTFTKFGAKAAPQRSTAVAN